jgi:peptidoglycan/xylan/chitin deacetylase (PgdA/CDA1 family)
MVDRIAAYGGKATFFVLGEQIDKNGTALLQYALDHGFELANHTDTHCCGDEMTEAQFRADVLACQAKVRDALGYEMKHLRTGGLGRCENLFSVSRELNLPIIEQIAGIGDWDHSIPAEEIFGNYMHCLRDGAIVLGHANAPATDAVLERYLQAATEQGYRLVTVSDLFAARCPKPPCGTPIGGVRADGTLYAGNQG